MNLREEGFYRERRHSCLRKGINDDYEVVVLHWLPGAPKIKRGRQECLPSRFNKL